MEFHEMHTEKETLCLKVILMESEPFLFKAAKTEVESERSNAKRVG